MAQVSHILVPTDGSQGALQAAAYAGDLARAFSARVTVISVLEEAQVMPSAWGLESFPTGIALSVEELRANLEKQARNESLANTVTALGSLPGAVEQVVAWGHHAETVCRYAAENGVDTIVIGSHGRSGIARAILGSVSSFVVNHAPCPVVVVRENNG